MYMYTIVTNVHWCPEYVLNDVRYMYTNVHYKLCSTSAIEKREPNLFIYLFIYCHLYSAFFIVQCSNALYRLWDGEIQGHTGQPSAREIDAHTMYNHWATAPGRSLNNPRPKSITHLRTFSDNGVYVALQLFLVILVSDQWRRVLIPYS